MPTAPAHVANLLDVALVMPVYNEAQCIGAVLRGWTAALQATGASFMILAINDGSTDSTARELDALTDLPGLLVIHKENSGHGPTILQGYAQAVTLARWVFQADSDDEMSATHFAQLWSRREDYTFLIATREGRVSSAGRRLITAVSRLSVGLFFGRGVKDVNCPYRLMRSDVLAAMLASIPPGTFAPNLCIAGLAGKWGLRIFQCPVPHTPRRTGTVSIVRWKLWKSAARAFAQTLAIALRAKAP